ncbi:Cof-type HAD-IIB family hydrolase [Halobacillus sp. ACCC02827]|uniref:Cof-type HAD-IIB family hydrolase n=1 Tax=unclassified Halobacillus TaxID=2636472 RepID=UPI0002A514EE|nr:MULTISPECIES: Cof-type HAD-IIB family hydrolase [unclassified Halobacillus]ELK48822.1 HAD superfamily hydrolase [Halobacillus sp. BAB-2008]WJE16652.1 Cof-type HAD-IIB family hydrolase [Halobacillus sp. ACCC02827]
MIKLFVTDLDGTLLGMDHYIKNEDIDALKWMIDHGTPLTVASGRMDHEIAEVLKRVGVNGHRVSQNGAFVYDNQGQEIYAETFEGNMAERILTAIEKEPMVKTVSTADQTFTDKHHEWVDIISEQLFHDIIIQPDLKQEIGQTIFPSKITLNGQEADVVHAAKNIKETFGEEIDSFISHETCVDMMPKGINKRNGIRKLIDKLGLKPEEVACVGDSFNDISMFEMTPHSYVMATAHDDVKAKASQVVDHVHEAIEDLEKKGLLNKKEQAADV